MISFNAVPLVKYSSLQTVSMLRLLGIKTSMAPNITFAFNFNLNTALPKGPVAQLTFHLRDDDIPKPVNTDFCIHQLSRWRMDISQCKSFDDYIKTLKSNHKRNYRETQKAFEEYGVTMSFIDGDWSAYAERAYELYLNVAKRHGSQLYDLAFFRAIAKIKEYKLICVWHQDTLISALIIFDEKPVYHSMLCGFDYEHSKNIYAYSLMHYQLIRLAIETQQHTIVDAGMTADKAKSMMNFKRIYSCMDVTASNFILKRCLRFFSRLVTATINDQAKLELRFHLMQKNASINNNK